MEKSYLINKVSQNIALGDLASAMVLEEHYLKETVLLPLYSEVKMEWDIIDGVFFVYGPASEITAVRQQFLVAGYEPDQVELKNFDDETASIDVRSLTSRLCLDVFKIVGFRMFDEAKGEYFPS